MNLTERALAQKGGDSGEAIVPGHAAESLLWERVSADEMPPKHPLSDSKKAMLKQWIDEGANWGDGALDMFSITTDSRAGRDWWSLQPLRQVPAPALDSGWVVVVEPPKPLAQWEFDSDLHDSIQELRSTAHGTARIEGGALILDGESYVESAPVSTDIAEKTLEAWIQLDNLDQRGGAAISIGSLNGGMFDAIVFGEREPKRWMAGSNNFLRSDSFDGTEETNTVDAPVHVAIVYHKDGTIIGYRNGMPYGRSIRKSELQPFKANQTQIVFGLRHKPPGGNRQLTGRLHRAALYDRALPPDEVAASSGDVAEYVSEDQFIASLDEPQREQRASLKTQFAELAKTREGQAVKAKQKFYTLKSGSGQTTSVLLRGDPDNVGEVVSPGATQAIEGLSADFDLPPDAPEVESRRKLAQWITSEDNPLFARVMVNRVWHYHFGVGIVDTPNDFGFNGGRPSHPDLLEFLTSQFRSGG